MAQLASSKRKVLDQEFATQKQRLINAGKVAMRCGFFSNEPRSTVAGRPKRDCACFASDIVQSAFAPLEVILQYHVQDCVGRDARLSTNMRVVNARLVHMLERAYRLNWQREDDAVQYFVHSKWSPARCCS